MEIENIHKDYRQTVLEHDLQAKRIKELETANMELTAALADRGEELKIYKEMAHGVLFKSVDKFLQVGEN